MIPKLIKRKNVIAAMTMIDKAGMSPLRNSRTYDVVQDGKTYPPKLLISLAHEVATGQILPSNVFSGGNETNGFLKGLGFQVQPKGKTIRAPRRFESKEVGTSTSRQTQGRKILSLRELKQLEIEFLKRRPIYSWDDLQSTPKLPPRKAGVYGWFFKGLPASIPTHDCVERERHRLLYVGISPESPQSSQTLSRRIRYHYRGNAEGSTLRRTLGCLLEDKLGTILQQSPSGRRLIFGDKEVKLTEWLARNARVTWVETDQPWILEAYLITRLSLPLNLRGNQRHTFYPVLSEIRAKARLRARGSKLALVLVACVSEKHNLPMAAQDLYSSTWFRKARRYAEQEADRWFILSAKHGLLAPNKIIAPYDQTLRKLTPADRLIWAKGVVRALKAKSKQTTRITIIAGELYRHHIEAMLRDVGHQIDVPMRGLPIGKQLSWLTKKFNPTGP